jgi:hypothetical protein
MLPIVAVGAALLGALVTKEILDEPGESKARSAKNGPSESAALPQSYYLVPAQPTPRRLSAAEAVGKMIL